MVPLIMSLMPSFLATTSLEAKYNVAVRGIAYCGLGCLGAD